MRPPKSQLLAVISSRASSSPMTHSRNTELNKEWGCSSWQRLRKGTLVVPSPPGLSHGEGHRFTEGRARASRDHTGRQTGTEKCVCVGGFPTRHGRSPQTLVGNVIEAIEIAALGARRD